MTASRPEQCVPMFEMTTWPGPRSTLGLCTGEIVAAMSCQRLRRQYHYNFIIENGTIMSWVSPDRKCQIWIFYSCCKYSLKLINNHQLFVSQFVDNLLSLHLLYFWQNEGVFFIRLVNRIFKMVFEWIVWPIQIDCSGRMCF